MSMLSFSACFFFIPIKKGYRLLLIFYLTIFLKSLVSRILLVDFSGSLIYNYHITWLYGLFDFFFAFFSFPLLPYFSSYVFKNSFEKKWG